MRPTFPTRIERRDPGTSRITPRDELILSFIADAQPVTTAQVRRLLELSEDMVSRRLAILRDHGLVVVHVRACHEANWYTVNTAGARLVARLRGVDASTIWVPRGIDRADLDHHRVAVDTYVAIRSATVRSHHFKLDAWRFERDIRRATGAAGPGVIVPDAAGRFVLVDGSMRAILVEVDLAKENPAFIAKKARSFAELALNRAPVLGTPEWSVACVIDAPHAKRRLHRLALAVAESGAPAGLWNFLVAEELEARTALTRVWLTPVVDPATNTVMLAPSSPFAGVGTKSRDCSDPSTPRSPRGGADREAEKNGTFTLGSGT